VSDCTVNYRPVFSSEKAPSKEEKVIVRQSKKSKIKIWSRVPKRGPIPRLHWSTDCRPQEELQLQYCYLELRAGHQTLQSQQISNLIFLEGQPIHSSGILYIWIIKVKGDIVKHNFLLKLEWEYQQIISTGWGQLQGPTA
jgi:hypothetical protein